MKWFCNVVSLVMKNSGVAFEILFPVMFFFLFQHLWKVEFVFLFYNFSLLVPGSERC